MERDIWLDRISWSALGEDTMLHTTKRMFEDLRSSGASLVCEVDAKRILREYGLNVPESILLNPLANENQMKSSVENVFDCLNPPVVLKAVCTGLAHKSDVGAVVTGIGHAAQLLRNYNEMRTTLAEQGIIVESFLVEEQATGLELVIGGVQDPSFGPIIMAGIGGVWIELFEDVSFRACPIFAADADCMLKELKGSKLFDNYRDTTWINRDKVVDLLVQIGGERGLFLDLAGEISEFDFNPVIFSGENYSIVDAIFTMSSSPGTVKE